MKAMDLLTLMGELDEVMTAPAIKPPKRRSLWVAAAACLCACMLGFRHGFSCRPRRLLATIFSLWSSELMTAWFLMRS